MLLAATLALFAILASAITLFGWHQFVRPAQANSQLGAPLVTSGTTGFKVPDAHAAFAFLNRVGALLPAGKKAATTKQLLHISGYRSAHALHVFQGLRIVALGIGIVMGLVLRPAESTFFMRMLLVIGGAGMGYVIPDFLLKKKVTGRKSQLKHSLPDGLDLITISVEAGLGLDQAIQYVATELHAAHAELSEELQLIGLEMRAGLRRSEALQSFADRTGEEEIGKLVGFLIQNDRFGTSMADSLRTHSQYLRGRQKRDAEESATKVGVKLVFPIFLFIMPSMMIVAAGPSLLQIFKYMIPMMSQFK